MNEVKIFSNTDFGELGILVEDGKELFPATDCARALGYTNPWDALKKHCRSLAKREVPHPQNPEKKIEINYIKESDLLRLITHSRLEAAIKFEAWVFEEVLPSIRKHGMYATPQTMQEMISNPDFAIQLLTKLKEEQETSAKLSAQIEEDKPMVAAAKAIEGSKDSILVGIMAKLIRQNGTSMGRDRLFKWLRENGYLGRFGNEYNVPTQYSTDRGILELKERPLLIKGEVKVTKTPMVTGKGQVYFLNKFMKGAAKA